MNKPHKKTFEPVYNIFDVLEYVREKYNFEYGAIRRYKRDLLDGIVGNGYFHYVGIGEDINPSHIEAAIVEEFGPIEKVWVEW